MQAETRVEIDPFQWTLEHKISRVEEEIVQKSRDLTRTLARVQDHIERGLHLNSLGELQSSGTRLDQDIALREQLYELKSQYEATR